MGSHLGIPLPTNYLVNMRWLFASGVIWLVAAAAVADEDKQPVAMVQSVGALHGFPSMSDPSGKIIADGEVTQELSNGRVVARVHWSFADGRRVEEHDEFRVGKEVVQERFSWTEKKNGEELRQFEVDFTSGKATQMTRDDKGQVKHEDTKLDLGEGRTYAGYGVGLAVIELASSIEQKDKPTAEISMVGFADKPRMVTLEVHDDGEETISLAGRSIPCHRYTLHPKLAFPVNLIAAAAGVKDAHLWLTSTRPHFVMRSEQNLITKDDPVVVVEAMPHGAAVHPR
jgi:hypothetical protein